MNLPNSPSVRREFPVVSQIFPRLGKVLQWMLVGGGGLFLIVYLWIAMVRLFYPFDLEWMEGAMVDTVERVINHQTIYVSPSVVFTPFIYTPVYYYLAAISAQIFGLGHGALRLISFIASLINLFLVYRFAQRESGRHFAGWIALGLFVATFSAGGAWFDLARVDSLMLTFVLASLYWVRFHPNGKGWALAGFLGFLAIFTKQSAFIMLLPLVGYTLITGAGIKRWLYLAVMGGFGALGFLLFQNQSNGWFIYYIWEVPAGHPWDTTYLWRFWLSDLGRVLPVACVLACLWLLLPILRKRGTPLLFYGMTTAGILSASFLARLHTGGYVNVLIPAYAWLSILASMGLQGFLEGWWRDPEKPAFIAHQLKEKMPVADFKTCTWLILMILQFLVLVYRPWHHVPTQADRDAGNQLLKILSDQPGPVWVPYQGFMSSRAGHDSYAHVMALGDVIRSSAPQKSYSLADGLDNVLRQQHFQTILLNHPWYDDALETYEVSDWNFADEMVFWPKTGMRTRPQRLLIRPRE